ncbi:hypothetical protein [Mesorhizobium sp.]|uniref:hypothetical protein n=1 Tax=Mesorhizobium sp. TaxID=1871066 RepID=UPI000FE2C048|nr:hypothetical protein [Mesorhizobium sp.]RWK28713.1 MAG: hypothetical protein EOR40_28230 [Mesorhizobium sp.]RWK91026.1 MAG: hypothetical protein EOR52_05705 [Mesorhizobium sp.]TIP17952.1 MAG: hypothetical protein E5X66_19065 [Mesorhizobium sp.]TJV81353.1 MAG: hypothetical protein E5X45_17030 [Mesorhizobium sp.]TJW17228.1 MAG: hypothetical protein E5X42_16205 [Mesorhizobium sp.]
MFPKSGRRLPPGPNGFTQETYAEMISRALVSDIGSSHLAAKSVMQWTGASERSARHWLHGDYGPGGLHLILLARNSRAVTRAILHLADRDSLELGIEISAARASLMRAAAIVDALTGQNPS